MQYLGRVRYWTGRRTLVTGAGGFIGGHLVLALVRAGADVRALCRYNSRGDRGTLEWVDGEALASVDVRFGDLRDPESVRDAVTGCEVVFHLGAQIAIPYSLLNPRDFVATNVGGTLNVVQAALDAGAARLLHLSTSEVYGEAASWPITERHPLAPRSACRSRSPGRSTPTARTSRHARSCRRSPPRRWPATSSRSGRWLPAATSRSSPTRSPA
jgi:nucleoside-diphosphate-sugar epimerase